MRVGDGRHWKQSGDPTDQFGALGKLGVDLRAGGDHSRSLDPRNEPGIGVLPFAIGLLEQGQRKGTQQRRQTGSLPGGLSLP